MQKFAIKIDMSTFFADERKNVIILVDPEWKNVEKLQERVEHIFEVRNVRFLSNEGYFLPPQESIEVVKFVKKLKSFIPTEVLEEKKKKKRKKSSKSSKEPCILSTNDEFYMPAPVNALLPQMKRKFISLQNGDGFFSSTPNQAKRKKEIEVFDAAGTQSQFTSNKSSEILSSSEQLGRIENCSAAENTEVSSQAKELVENNHSSNDQTTNQTNPKRKIPDQTGYSHNGTTGTLAASNSLKNETRDQSAGIRSYKSKRNVEKNITHSPHIFFDEVENETTETSGLEPGSLKIPIHINFHCALAKIDMNRPRIFSPKSKPSIEIQNVVVLTPAKKQDTQSVNFCISNEETKLSNLNQKKYPVEAGKQEDKSLVPLPNTETEEDNKSENAQLQQSAYNTQSIVALDSIELQEDSRDDESQLNVSKVIDLTETEDGFPIDVGRDKKFLRVTAENSSSLAVNLEEIKIANILPFCVKLKTLPNVGDVLLFKTRFLNSSAVSNFMAGRCERVNKRTKSLKILLMDGLEEVIHLPTKYVCNLDDSIETMEINIKLADMYEAKVFKMP